MSENERSELVEKCATKMVEPFLSAHNARQLAAQCRAYSRGVIEALESLGYEIVKKETPEPETPGTILGRQARREMNGASQKERQELYQKGMNIINSPDSTTS